MQNSVPEIQNLDDPFGSEEVIGFASDKLLTPPSLSDNAAKQILKIAAKESKAEAMLRLKVTGGGCSGFQYHFDLDWQALPNDMIIENLGAKMVVDPSSLPFLDGAILDYVDDLVGSYFKVVNPVAKSSCGCGTSFSV